ncbi:hypothetical protein PC123_g8962 [Phytophthora cactorum]|nr:hypothetical protein PC123_g8962 [Phytophthora cactorum]
MSIHEVENALTRAMSKLCPVTVKAVKKCLEGLAIKVGHKLEKEMGTLFGLMFDGWSHAGVHYVALFAVYEADGKLHVSLLGLSPLTDGSQTADAHVKLFENILDVYDKTKDMVGFLMGDNCNTNQSVANKLGVPHVGEHPYGGVASENNYAELKKPTELLPVKRNVTRRSSTFTMVQRYILIRAEIKKVEAVEELIPTGAKH